MQHPSSNSTRRTPEMLRQAQAVLAVTATAYGLARRPESRTPSPSRAGAAPGSAANAANAAGACHRGLHDTGGTSHGSCIGEGHRALEATS
jgi:hypothetical protein